MYYDLKSGKLINEEKNKLLGFLYDTALGRCVLKIATTKAVSNIYAIYMNSPLSRRKIKGFIKANAIDMSEYKEKKYKSFNDFFIREIEPEKRTPESGFIAVCDSKLTVYKIDENDLCYKLFIEKGFEWGGSWEDRKDYQHFEIPTAKIAEWYPESA